MNEEAPTQQTIDNLRSLSCERFPAKAVEVTPIPFNVELAELQQRTDEPLSSYYKRVTSLMQRVSAKDRATGTRLSLLESAMLDSIIRAFVKGITDHTIRQEAARSIASNDKSLRNIYNVAEETRRTNIEVQKLLEEGLRADELGFYKQLAESNMPKQKISTLLTSYDIAKAGTQSNRASPFQWSPGTVHFAEPHAQPERPKVLHAGTMARQDPRFPSRGNPNHGEKV